jgi:hypothetical protein
MLYYKYYKYIIIYIMYVDLFQLQYGVVVVGVSVSLG